MIVDPPLLEQTLHDLLADAPAGRILLSELGSLLRTRLPGFSPEQFGYPNLRDLLSRFPAVGTIMPGAKPPALFLVSPSGKPPPVEESSSPLPKREGGRVPQLRPEWWRAIVEFQQSYQAWLDLKTMTLCEDAAAVAAEPERYLAIPRMPLDEQRTLAKQFAEQQETPGRERLLQSLDNDRLLRAFLEEASQLGLKQAWSYLRTHSVVTLAETWAGRHEITPDVLFEPSGRPQGGPSREPRSQTPSVELQQPTSATASTGRTGRMEIPVFRQFLHEIIDQMTEPELMQLTIPGRFLLLRSR